MLFNRRGCGCCRPACPPRNINVCEGVTEPAITKCIEKEFYHEVPHVCPIHTHTINRHIYTHTYRPEYSCSEEDQVVNNDCGNCQGF